MMRFFQRKIPATIQASGRNIPTDLKLTADLDIKAAASEKDCPTFFLAANSGKPMMLSGFDDPVIIDFATSVFDKNKTPVIADHNTSKRIGHTTEQLILQYGQTGEIDGHKVSGPGMFAAGIVSSKSETAKGYIEDAKAGFPFQVSIGAPIDKARFVKEGEQAVINGSAWNGPLIVASVRTRELSVLTLGADSQTSATIAAGDFQMKTFAEWLKAEYSLDEPSLTAEQKTKLHAAYEKSKTPPVVAAPAVVPAAVAAPATTLAAVSEEERVKARQAKDADEEDRQEAIRDIFARYPDVKELVLEEGKPAVKAKAVLTKAIRDGWTPDKTEVAVMRAERPSGREVRIAALGPAAETEHLADAIVANLCRFNGVRDEYISATSGEKSGLKHWFPEKVLEASKRNEVRRITRPSSLIDTMIRAAGMQGFMGDRSDENYFRLAQQAHNQITASYNNQSVSAEGGPFSTLTVTNILEALANKLLLASYEAQEVVWPQIAAVKNLNDFKVHNFYRLTVNGGYRKIGSTGELKHGEFGDQKYTVQGDTFGMLLALSRQDIINDDLNSFMEIPRAMGRLAALALEFEVFKLLLAGTLFSGGNKNLIVNVFGIDGITAAQLNYRNKVDDFGKPILVTPDRLIVGAQHEVIGSQIYKDTNLLATNIATTGAVNGLFQDNPHVSKYRPVVTPMLNNTDIRDMDGNAFTGQDGIQWYLMADPNKFAAFMVGFVMGHQTPVVQSADTSFNTLGVQYRSIHDWGVGLGDPRAAVKSSGGG